MGQGAEVTKARCIPETLGKSKTAFPSHHHADLVLHVETPWAGLATSLSPHQRHQLILEVHGQGAGSEQESPLPRRDLRMAEKLQQAFEQCPGARAAGLCAPPRAGEASQEEAPPSEDGTEAGRNSHQVALTVPHTTASGRGTWDRQTELLPCTLLGAEALTNSCGCTAGVNAAGEPLRCLLARTLAPSRTSLSEGGG